MAKKNGEAPVFIDSSTIAKNIERFKQYYKNKGFFNTHVEVKKDFYLIKKELYNI